METGITNVNGKDMFGNYHSITETDIATVKADRTNDRAVHNARALYKVLQTSLTGYIKTQMFSNIANVPSVDYVA